MSFESKLRDTQETLRKQGIDGWLLYDFHRNNSLAVEFLEIPADTMLTRRLLYWIPAQGEPVRVVHKVDSTVLNHLPGEKYAYSSWQEYEKKVEDLLKDAKKVAMEYSPRNRIPYVSKVDAGTIDMVRDCGVEVVTSAAFLQRHTSVLDEGQMRSHFEAAEVVSGAVEKAWVMIGQSLKKGQSINEYQVQQFIMDEFRSNGCVWEGDPIVAVNEHSADPHFAPTPNNSREIKEGDFILIDLWCKKNEERAVYADITRVGVAAASPTERQKEIFSIVKQARDEALDLVRQRFSNGASLMGWEVDQKTREVITASGYDEFFTHRTGHSIDRDLHGTGAHIDNLETQDQREVLEATCFSVEPGIYLPDEFGVRLELDVLIGADRTVSVTGGEQKEIRCLL
ncbi:MAG: peptidase [Waddliaceae bacterium]|nr:peptidase [Waddliaceae bacterium]